MNTGALRLTVSARTENVAIVRQAVTALGEDAGLSDVRLGDLKTAVTEACMNAVVHAYNGEPGPIVVRATEDDGFLDVRVRDFGGGFQPRPGDGTSLHLGIPLIAALADGFAISGTQEGGTEVAIRMRLNGASGAAVSESEPELAPASARLTFSDPQLPISAVLARVIGMFAARAEFSLDRLSDTVLLGEAVSNHAYSDFTNGEYALEVLEGEGGVELRIGPLVAGAGERLLASLDTPGLPPGKLRGLASGIEIVTGPGETESVRLSFSS